MVFFEDINTFYKATPETAYTLTNLPSYNPDLENIIIVIGVNAMQNGPFMQCLLKATIAKKTYNVFYWDWSKEAAVLKLWPLPENLLVLLTFGKVAPTYVVMGILLGKTVVSMADTGRLNLSRTIILGNSLGAHVAGVCSQYIIKIEKKILSRISGCDPPYLYDVSPSLSKDCARFVDVIHTDLTLSKKKSSGTADFYVNEYRFPTTVNKDEVQPGCPPRGDQLLSWNALCSHNRAIELWVQSFIKKLEAFKIIAGVVVATSYIGYQVDVTATGDYYINTTDFAQCLSYDGQSTTTPPITTSTLPTAEPIMVSTSD